MRRIRTFFYCLGQGIRSIFSHGMFSLATIGTVAASLFLLGIFYFVASNVRYVIKEAEQNVGIMVLFEEGTDEEGIREIGEAIRLRSEVADIVYISAEQAWETYKASLDPDEVKSFGTDNPLENSASYKVLLKDVERQSELVSYVMSIRGVRHVNAMDSVAESLSGLNKVVSVISAAIILILVGVAVFLIRTTVSMGIAVRKEEISIMNLIGATDFFIRFPFTVEGILLGLMGAAIPLGLLRLGYVRIVGLFRSKFGSALQSLSFVSEKNEFQVLTPLLLGIGVLLGWLGSAAASKKQLKRTGLR